MVAKLFSYRSKNFLSYFSTGVLRRFFCTPASLIEDSSKNCVYKYLLVLDFEATCDRKRYSNQEIIEFPCIKFNLKTLMEEARFHHYVKPIEKPILTNFCVELTGILQEMVDESEPFPVIYKLFEEWREKEGLTKENSLYVTTGDWDLGHMMKTQCQISNLKFPSHMLVWADLRKVFGNNKLSLCQSFNEILEYYKMEFEGRRHSGIDDCLNMVRVIRKMVEEGIEFKPTSVLSINTMKVITTKPPPHEAQIKRLENRNFKRR